MRLTLDSIVVVVFCPKEGQRSPVRIAGGGSKMEIINWKLFSIISTFLEYPTDVVEKRLYLTQNSQRMSLRGVEENECVTDKISRSLALKK